MFGALTIAFLLCTAYATSISSRLSGDGILSLECGSIRSSDELKIAEALFHKNRVTNSASALRPRKAAVINVYFNVIYKDTTAAGGYGTDAEVAALIDSLNDGFSQRFGLSFNLVETNRILNTTWFNSASPINTKLEFEMKSALRKGDASDLNIYTVGFTEATGFAGEAKFPDQYAANPEIDGVFLNYRDFAVADQGKTLVHEVGHWVGLYHTFQGGCVGDGDFVDDTPAEDSPGFCNRGRDSCPDQPGLDPVENYMDYAGCRSVWTDGQIARARDQLATYRGIRI